MSELINRDEYQASLIPRHSGASYDSNGYGGGASGVFLLHGANATDGISASFVIDITADPDRKTEALNSKLYNLTRKLSVDSVP